MIDFGTKTSTTLPSHLASAENARPQASMLRVCVALLAIAQTLTVIIASAAAKWIYIDLYLGQAQSFIPYFLPSAVLALVLSLFFRRFELNTIDTLAAPTLRIGRVIGCVTLSFLVLLGILYVLKSAEELSRGWFLCWYAISIFALVLLRWTFMTKVRRLIATGRLRIKTALVGATERTIEFRTQLTQMSPETEVIGLYTVDKVDDRAQGSLDELKRLTMDGLCDRVIICLQKTDRVNIGQAIKCLASCPTELLMCTDLTPAPLPVHGSRTVAGVRLELVAPVPASEDSITSKRLLDWIVASISLVFLSPFLLLIALLIKSDSPGPVFFRQRRYGRHNTIFPIYKFRTMNVSEDGPDVQQAQRNDARVTRVGRVLRATSIDELPQIINVFLGHMSIVGPRPHALAHDQIFERRFDMFSRRRRVLPGITGWAQVNGYRGETKTEEDIKNRMDFDLFYIDNWSIWLDIEIIARTVVTVLRGAH